MKTNLSSDILIIGAGIIGLATAYRLQQTFPHLKITILEKEGKCGVHQSTRNSGVVHSGVYYKPGSLKAQNCIEGRAELLEFCRENGIFLKQLGKVIVATQDKELPYLSELGIRGQSNGVKGLKLLTKEQLKEIEPHASGIQALWIPECYSIHFQDVVEKLLMHFRKSGGEIFFGEKVEAMTAEKNQVIIETSTSTYRTAYLINCAGLHSDRIASLILNKEEIPFQIIPFRGEYWELVEKRRDLVGGLIYPVPDPNFPFLGVHLSRMADGRVVAGPNAVLALAREGYRKSQFDLQDCLRYLCYPGFWKMAGRYWDVGCKEMLRTWSKKAFVKEAQRLIPELEEEDFIEGGSGVRAQVVKKDGTMLDDFAIVKKHNTLHVLNAPSPAATSCLSIAKHICRQTEEVLGLL
ncbi:MAG: L-2-hydroxyglutarate oxidase [Chlamydiota bacterium]